VEGKIKEVGSKEEKDGKQRRGQGGESDTGTEKRRENKQGLFTFRKLTPVLSFREKDPRTWATKGDKERKKGGGHTRVEQNKGGREGLIKGHQKFFTPMSTLFLTGGEKPGTEPLQKPSGVKIEEKSGKPACRPVTRYGSKKVLRRNLLKIQF